jgi:hypothetical protein
MKIHEPLGDPADLELVGAAAAATAIYRDTMATLRSEFKEFIAQTRERLDFVCEALQQEAQALPNQPAPSVAIENNAIELRSAIESNYSREPSLQAESVRTSEYSPTSDDPFERINAIKQRLAKQINNY